MPDSVTIWPTSENLTAAQNLLLRWHYRLSHLNFQRLQDLARQGRLPKRILGYLPPLCHSCLLSKAYWRASPSANDARHIDSGDLPSGDRGCWPDTILNTRLYWHLQRKANQSNKNFASVYVDHASRYTFVTCTFSTSDSKEVKRKRFFEQLAAKHTGQIMVSWHVMNMLNQQNITYLVSMLMSKMALQKGP